MRPEKQLSQEQLVQQQLVQQQMVQQQLSQEQLVQQQMVQQQLSQEQLVQQQMVQQQQVSNGQVVTGKDGNLYYTGSGPNDSQLSNQQHSFQINQAGQPYPIQVEGYPGQVQYSVPGYQPGEGYPLQDVSMYSRQQVEQDGCVSNLQYQPDLPSQDEIIQLAHLHNYAHPVEYRASHINPTDAVPILSGEQPVNMSRSQDGFYPPLDNSGVAHQSPCLDSTGVFVPGGAEPPKNLVSEPPLAPDHLNSRKTSDINAVGDPNPRPGLPPQVSCIPDLDMFNSPNNIRLELAKMLHNQTPVAPTVNTGELCLHASTAPVLFYNPLSQTFNSDYRRGSLPVVQQNPVVFLSKPKIQSVDEGLDKLILAQYSNIHNKIPFPDLTTRRRSADPSEIYRSRQSLKLGSARSGSASPSRDGDDLLAYLERRRSSSGSVALSPVLESLGSNLSVEQMRIMSTIREMGSQSSLKVPLISLA